MFHQAGLTLRQGAALATWGLGVLVVLRVAFDVFQITGGELAVLAVVVVVGSFYGVFMPLWRRLPEDWRRG